MNAIIEIFHADNDEFFVTDSSGAFDDFSTFDEQEAIDEAQSWADEIGGIVTRYN